MSDGPSATLQMDRLWRRVARCAENDASDPQELCSKIGPASFIADSAQASL